MRLLFEVFQPPLKVSWLLKRFRKTMPSALLSLDQSLPQTQINDNLRRIKVTRCDTFASVELTLQSFVWRMDEDQIKTESKHATELVLIIDSISSLIDRDTPEQDVLGTAVIRKTPLKLPILASFSGLTAI